MARKILMVIPSLTKGGAESQLVLLALLLKKHTSFTPYIIVLYTGGDLEKELKLNGIKYKILNLFSSHKWMPLLVLYFWWMARRIRKDNVHAVLSFLFHANLYGYIMARALQVKSIISIRNSDQFQTDSRFKRKVYNYIQRWLFNRCTYVTFNSKNVRDAYCDMLRPGQEAVIYNGISLTSSSGEEKMMFAYNRVVLNVSHIKKKKDIATYIRAAKRVVEVHKDVLFLHIGGEVEAAYAHEMYALAEKLLPEEQFKFIGEVYDVTPYYKNATVYVQTSRAEGYSNTIIEAGLNGLPMVVTDVDGNTEAVEDGENGFTVPAGSSERIAEKIILLLDNQEMRKRFGSRVQQLFSERHKNETMLNSYLELLRD